MRCFSQVVLFEAKRPAQILLAKKMLLLNSTTVDRAGLLRGSHEKFQGRLKS
jgi:hypothetical protein